MSQETPEKSPRLTGWALAALGIGALYGLWRYRRVAEGDAIDPQEVVAQVFPYPEEEVRAAVAAANPGDLRVTTESLGEGHMTKVVVAPEDADRGAIRAFQARLVRQFPGGGKNSGD